MSADTDIVRMTACVAATAAVGAPLLLAGGRAAAAVRWWAMLTPGVLMIHYVVNSVFLASGVPVEEHPLAKNTPQPAVLVLQACILAPIIEEVIFRGLILFALRATHEALTWVVLAGTVGVATYYGGEAPAVFAGLVAVAWVGVRFTGADRGVYGSAALFAAVHSAVWPTPIPLFALGLGLGAVAARTNGVLAPAIVHGLFNAVSVLFVLSGGAK